MDTLTCPDGGTCHHDCAGEGDPITAMIVGGTHPPGSCFRVRTCEPLSDVYPNDQWPPDILTAHAAPPAPDKPDARA